MINYRRHSYRILNPSWKKCINMTKHNIRIKLIFKDRICSRWTIDIVRERSPRIDSPIGLAYLTKDIRREINVEN